MKRTSLKRSYNFNLTYNHQCLMHERGSRDCCGNPCQFWRLTKPLIIKFKTLVNKLSSKQSRKFLEIEYYIRGGQFLLYRARRRTVFVLLTNFFQILTKGDVSTNKAFNFNKFFKFHLKIMLSNDVIIKITCLAGRINKWKGSDLVRGP